MADFRELLGTDAAWLAVDASGQVAVFTTGGEGPVPETAIPFTESGEELVFGLPEVTSVDLLTTVPRPDDFLAFCKRGLFAYDWSDAHRTSPNSLGGYELQARPLEPRRITDMPMPLQAVAAATQLSGVVFGAPIVVPTSLVGA